MRRSAVAEIISRNVDFTARQEHVRTESDIPAVERKTIEKKSRIANLQHHGNKSETRGLPDYLIFLLSNCVQKC